MRRPRPCLQVGPWLGIDLELKSVKPFVDGRSSAHCVGDFAAFIYPNGMPDPASQVRLGPLRQQFNQERL